MRLVIFPNTPDQQVIELYGSAATLGRAEGNTVLISGKRVADYHARITYEDGAWEIADLAGQSDIILDGNQTEKGLLSVGCRVLIGDASLLVMTLDKDEENVISVPAAVAVSDRSLVSRPYTPPAEYPMMPQNPAVTSILPRMALVFSLCGPFLLGIGWLLGGILGIVSLFRDG